MIEFAFNYRAILEPAKPSRCCIEYLVVSRVIMAKELLTTVMDEFILIVTLPPEISVFK